MGWLSKNGKRYQGYRKTTTTKNNNLRDERLALVLLGYKAGVGDSCFKF